MKKFILIISILIISGSIFANSKPPKEVLNSFNEKFPAVSNVKWAKENNDEWEANFILNGVKSSVNFSEDGKWLESEIEIPVTELPEKVISSINTAYNGYSIKGAAKIENVKGETIYEADLKSGKKKKEVFYMEDGTNVKY